MDLYNKIVLKFYDIYFIIWFFLYFILCEVIYRGGWEVF